MRKWKILAPLALCVTLLFGGTQAEASWPCNTWITVSTTAKTYSPCNRTTIGPWTSPLGGCLQYVSWRRTQQRVVSNGAHTRYQRVLLENEVRAQFEVNVGPVSVHKTQTMPGSHQTNTISSTSVSGTFHCGVANGSGSW